MERVERVTRPDGLSRRSLFERVYGAAITLKGIDGVLELLAGLLLLFAPHAIRVGLRGTAAEAREGASPLASFIADELIRADRWVAGGVALLAIVLLVHGVVKIVTVYCLLRRIIVAYPWAVVVLAGLLVWQGVVYLQNPSVGSAVLVVLDVVVLGLVAREWRLLVAERRREQGLEVE